MGCAVGTLDGKRDGCEVGWDVGGITYNRSICRSQNVTLKDEMFWDK